MTDTIESTADEIGTDENVHALVSRPSSPIGVTPNVGADELVARLAVIRTAMETAMQEGIDYGRIPGVDKPTLFKPGAEKLGVLFQLDVQLQSTKTWGPGEHLTVETRATVFHVPTGVRLGFGEGLATTREKKHAKRKQERLCPACGAPAVIAGKAEYGGGWLCWKKRDGCGAKFAAGDRAIEDQEVGTVDNPELPDAWNNVVKMAAKRARVDSVLAVTGASALFTQDAEDLGGGDPPAPSQSSRPSTPVRDDIAEVKRLGRLNKLKVREWRNLLRALGLEVAEKAEVLPLIESLSPEHAEALLGLLRSPIPNGESDLPAPAADEFTHPPMGDVPQELDLGPS